MEDLKTHVLGILKLEDLYDEDLINKIIDLIKKMNSIDDEFTGNYNSDKLLNDTKEVKRQIIGLLENIFEDYDDCKLSEIVENILLKCRI